MLEALMVRVVVLTIRAIFFETVPSLQVVSCVTVVALHLEVEEVKVAAFASSWVLLAFVLIVVKVLP